MHGPAKTTYPYGNRDEPGRCNDHGRSPMAACSVSAAEPPARVDAAHERPALNKLAGTLAKTGEHAGCTNGYGVYDMVGNLHEWVDDPDGTFLGGYYLDTHQSATAATTARPGTTSSTTTTRLASAAAPTSRSERSASFASSRVLRATDRRAAARRVDA